MAETFKEYKQRIFGYIGNQDPLKVQRATAVRLERLIQGVPRRKLARRPAPGKWSPVEILAHLADSEIAYAWRLRSMLGRNGAKLQAFDQNAWAMAGNYTQRDPRKSIALFRTVRQSNLALLASIPRKRWNSLYGMHEERGKETVATFARLFAGHDLNHLQQIEKQVRASRR